MLFSRVNDKRNCFWFLLSSFSFPFINYFRFEHCFIAKPIVGLLSRKWTFSFSFIIPSFRSIKKKCFFFCFFIFHWEESCLPSASSNHSFFCHIHTNKKHDWIQIVFLYPYACTHAQVLSLSSVHYHQLFFSTRKTNRMFSLCTKSVAQIDQDALSMTCMCVWRRQRKDDLVFNYQTNQKNKSFGF